RHRRHRLHRRRLQQDHHQHLRQRHGQLVPRALDPLAGHQHHALEEIAMSLRIRRTVLAAALTLASGAAFAQAQPPSAAPVRIDGAAAGAALARAAAAEYAKAKVALGVSGSAGGLSKLCRGEIDIANATRPINKAELAACKDSGTQFIELPVAMDAITVIVN